MKRIQLIKPKITEIIYLDGFHGRNIGFYLYIDYLGIGWNHFGDEVIWIWPWKRDNPTHAFFSMFSHGSFEHLEEVNEFWHEYHKACWNDERNLARNEPCPRFELCKLV